MEPLEDDLVMMLVEFSKVGAYPDTRNVFMAGDEKLFLDVIRKNGIPLKIYRAHVVWELLEES